MSTATESTGSQGSPSWVIRLQEAVRLSWDSQRSVYIAFFGLAIMIVIYALVQPDVFTFAELNLQTSAALALVIVAAGQTIVLLSGSIDLSVGGILSLATCLAATKFEGHGGVLLWSVLIVLMGAAAGLLNGLLVAYLKLASFIVTLATWSIFSGLALLVLAQPGGIVPESYVSTLTGTVGEVGVPVLILAGLIILWIWFRGTRTLSKIRGVGSDAEASRLAGVKVSRVRVLAFVLSGVLAALAGLFLSAQLASGDPLVGNSFVLNSVAAAVIGGTTLAGGRGDVLGGIAGAFLITLLGSVVFVLDLPAYWQPIAAGGLLILAVLANSISEIRRERKG